MSSLERTKQGSITINQTNTLEEVKEGICREYKIEEVLDYPVIEVDENLYRKIKNGVKVFNQWNIKDKVLFKTKENQLRKNTIFITAKAILMVDLRVMNSLCTDMEQPTLVLRAL